MPQQRIEVAKPAIAVAEDEGQRKFFANVFSVMSLGLMATGLIAWTFAHTVGFSALFELQEVVKEGKTVTEMAPSGWWLSAVGLYIFCSFFFPPHEIAASSRTGLLSLVYFLVYTGIVGVVVVPVAYAYTEASLMQALLITASGFLACALWGHTTKKDLTSLAVFLIMGLVGILAAMIVNLFLASPAINFAVSAAAVFIFSSITAYEMQELRKMYHEEKDKGTGGLVVYGAISLYLNFLNLFLHVLRFFGVPKKD